MHVDFILGFYEGTQYKIIYLDLLTWYSKMEKGSQNLGKIRNLLLFTNVLRRNAIQK